MEFIAGLFHRLATFFVPRVTQEDSVGTEDYGFFRVFTRIGAGGD